ncbi:hypothetical protein [Helicobacter marmotae]|uniref:hypothetical protein n=1 Tax=Helicobacter marmotae TaxID=152490 RepID=UPI0013159712|nr:hypothetical protein [Helicobacter marmotae]
MILAEILRLLQSLRMTIVAEFLAILTEILHPLSEAQNDKLGESLVNLKEILRFAQNDKLTTFTKIPNRDSSVITTPSE